MCGICCIFDENLEQNLKSWKECIKKSRLCRRGPDGSGDSEAVVNEESSVLLSGHILHLRGRLTRQPLRDDNGNFLLWNGEIFNGIKVSSNENDTAILLSFLAECQDEDDILSTLAKIRGPWSFIYWNESTGCLWFGRDMFGRRSLLWHLPQNDEDSLIISSTQIGDQNFREIPSVGIFCVRFPDSVDKIKLSQLAITLYPRQDAVWPGTRNKVDTTASLTNSLFESDNSLIKFILDTTHTMPSPMPKLNTNIPTDCDVDIELSGELDINSSEGHLKYLLHMIQNEHAISKIADQFIAVLQKAVTIRVFNQPLLKYDIEALEQQISKAISKPLDISVKKTKRDYHKYKQNTEGVSSTAEKHVEYVSSKTRTTSSYRDSCSFDCKTSSSPSCGQSLLSSYMASSSSSESVKWDKSDKADKTSANIAILFSGGIDSAVLAALVDRCLPEKESIDLINVAFEQVDKGQNEKMTDGELSREDKRWLVPDRVTGYSALEELNPNRKWNFVEVNVSREELQQARSEHVRHLVYPLETVLDDSIGCAVWFAARSLGIINYGARKGTVYKSSAKVIISGMGADEQFAGYSRHRGKFEELGWQGLVDEMELEITRISARNLGRDDRIIADHGKESRFPFLDENVVEFLSALPVQNKANLKLPRGLGEKLLLRLCAVKLGLRSTAVLPKRAIQFGSRIAKLENSKEKASDKCARLLD